MDDFQNNLEKYAELAVTVGVNLKEKEGLIIGGNQNTLPLARLIMKKAYEKGAKHVEFQLQDDEMTLIKFNHGKDYVFESFPTWKVDSLESMYKDNYHQIIILSDDPELLKDIDSEKISKNRKSTSQEMARVMKYRMTGLTKWNIIAMPSIPWAKSVFPELSEEEALKKLWKKVFQATRVSQNDPIEAWKQHDIFLKKYKDFLNENNFKKLIYKAPGTDLEVFLANEHYWMGGSKISQGGDSYVANIPTEEVFTTPHRLKVNGTLKATKPLSLNGKLVENFGFTFKDGQVVDFYAEKGEDVLKDLLKNDEGAIHLGEIALVQDNSPISNTGILFKETLFDENASCHFALGRAYPYAMKNGSNMSEEELMSKGANFSLIHVDFMVGSPELDIFAIKKNGQSIQLFKNGNWTF